jgi:hypothetical protein
MSEKKIVVPEGMHRAAVEWLLLYENFKVDTLEPSTSTPEQQANGRASVVLEAVLRWQSNRSPEISKELLERLATAGNVSKETAYDIVDIALRRMYDAPEPEVPKEIEDLLLVDAATFKLPDGDNFYGSAADRNAAVIEAYHRGQKSKTSD